MHAVTSWFKNMPDHPPEKPDHLVVSEALLLELQYQIREAEEMARERKQQEKIRQTGVDYSWLVTKHPKSFEIPELEKLELEELCMKVKPSECGHVINAFRDALPSEPIIQSIPKIFRQVIHKKLDERPKEESLTVTEWVRSWPKLRKNSSKVQPVDFDQGQPSPSSSYSNTGSSHRVTKVEDLPV